MDNDTFERICRDLLDMSMETLFRKSEEYSTNQDRLANFRQPTKMMNMSQAEVCLMYQMKHISSIAKIAKDSSNGILPTEELLREKCQDMLNYTLLFYANMIDLINQAGEESQATRRSTSEYLQYLDRLPWNRPEDHETLAQESLDEDTNYEDDEQYPHDHSKNYSE